MLRSRGKSGAEGGFPASRGEFVQALLGMRGDADEDIADVELAVGDVHLQRRPLLIQVAERVAERRLRQGPRSEPVADLLEPGEQRYGARLAGRMTGLGRRISDLALASYSC